MGHAAMEDEEAHDGDGANRDKPCLLVCPAAANPDRGHGRVNRPIRVDTSRSKCRRRAVRLPRLAVGALIAWGTGAAHTVAWAQQTQQAAPDSTDGRPTSPFAAAATKPSGASPNAQARPLYQGATDPSTGSP